MNEEIKRHRRTQRCYSHALAMLLLCVSFEASAEDWTSINKAKEYEILVDMDSYNESGGQPYITSKTIFRKPQNYRINQKALTYVESQSITQFNCTLHTAKNIINNFYDKKEKLVGSEKGSNQFKSVVSGSTNASLESLVCQVHRMVGGQ